MWKMRANVRRPIRRHRKQQARAFHLRTGRHPRRTIEEPANWSVAGKAAGSAGAGSRTARRKGKRSRARIFSGGSAVEQCIPTSRRGAADESRWQEALDDLLENGERVPVCRLAPEARTCPPRERLASASSLADRHPRARFPDRSRARRLARGYLFLSLSLFLFLTFKRERKNSSKDSKRAEPDRGAGAAAISRSPWLNLIAHQVPAREIEPRRRAHSRQVLTRAWLRC